MGEEVIKVNPCRYCALSIKYKDRHYSSLREQCNICSNRKNHEKYLASKRKYEMGEKIQSLSELLEQTWVDVGRSNSPTHIKAIKSGQLRTVQSILNQEKFYKAKRRENDGSISKDK